ncbi:MAG: hypothetical protein HY216_17695 [Candidatus Rokubacteria bacterium]|nr:hypothetical protein [Candidatus Rokubacteria bacterium]
MSTRGRRSVVRGALLTAALGLLPTGAGATHFAWLGHTVCPWDPVSCATRVPASFRSLGELPYGVFHIVDEAAPEWRGEQPTETLRTRDGQVIARVGPRFRHELDAQGSARLRDGRIVNTEEHAGGQSRYLVVRNAPFGIGAPGYKLMPYRTIAVDGKRIRVGTVLYVPALAGVKLSDGEIHDGFCFAHDTHDTDGGIGLFIGFDRDTDKTVPALAGKRRVRAYAVDAETAAALNGRFKARFDFKD